MRETEYNACNGILAPPDYISGGFGKVGARNFQTFPPAIQVFWLTRSYLLSPFFAFFPFRPQKRFYFRETRRCCWMSLVTVAAAAPACLQRGGAIKLPRAKKRRSIFGLSVRSTLWTGCRAYEEKKQCTSSIPSTLLRPRHRMLLLLLLHGLITLPVIHSSSGIASKNRSKQKPFCDRNCGVAWKIIVLTEMKLTRHR